MEVAKRNETWTIPSLVVIKRSTKDEEAVLVVCKNAGYSPGQPEATASGCLLKSDWCMLDNPS